MWCNHATRIRQPLLAMKTFPLALSLAVLGCLGSETRAASWYVSPSGLDSAAGSDSAPLLTINKAVSLAKPGDTVFVAAGSYPERVVTVREGLPTARITIQGPSRLDAEVKQFVINHSWVRVQGFKVLGQASAYEGAISIGKTAHGVVVANNQVSAVKDVLGLKCNASSTSVTEGSCSNLVVIGNTFGNCGGHAVMLRGVNGLIVSNVFNFNNGNDAMQVFGRGHAIVKNRFFNISHMEGYGNHPDICQTFGSGGNESYEILFEGNVAMDCAGQGVRITADGVANVRDWRIVNNLFVNQGAATVMCAADRVSVWNNTFINCTTNTAHPVSWFDSASGLGSNGSCYNNIFVGCGANPTSKNFGMFYASGRATNTFMHDHNFVAGPAPTFAPKSTNVLRDGTTWSFTDEHGINGVDPMFRSLDTRDFRLAKGSPLADKGMGIMLLGAVTSDLESKPRGMGAGWDIGAYEYGDEPAPVSGVTVE